MTSAGPMSVESDTWWIVIRGVLLTCWILTATHGGLLKDVGQLSCSLDPSDESLSICTHFRKAMLLLSCCLSPTGADMNPHICLAYKVSFPLSSCLSLCRLLFVYHWFQKWPERREKKEIRCLMVRLGNLLMLHLVIYLTDCRQAPCYIHYCPHLIPCSGTAKIHPCQISNTANRASITSFSLAEWIF